jgi:hypothetical protein
MAEGLAPTEVGKEIAQHARHENHERRDRMLSIAEAVLLSLVALLAAWSGYAAAKWSTDSRVSLAEASTIRTKANRLTLEAMELRNFDSSTFEAWFAAFTARNGTAMALAEHRFRPAFRKAFEAWRLTKPETNSNAPRGPTYMPEYRQPELARALALDEQAEKTFATGAADGKTADDYVRTTVFLAVVLFVVGISTHFPLRSARYGLISLGAALLVISLVLLAQLPRPKA